MDESIGPEVTNGAAPTPHFIEDLAPGMTASLSKTVTATDIADFAAITGDTNPLHLDEAYAAATMFKGRIAHGMLAAGLISAVIGTRLPGPGGVYMSQSLKFRAPVRIGDTVIARVTIREVIPEKRRAVIETVCTVDGAVVVDGEALILVPSRAEA